MKRIVNKIFCIASAFVICAMSELPVFALTEEKTAYTKMNNSGEVYKTIVDGKETEESSPIKTEIKYYLDGTEITASDLKGKSGKVKIEINYTNTDVKKVTLDGKNVTMYTPYVVACGMMLDNTLFSNVTVSSGKTVDNGSNTVVIGIAMPGLQESLGLSSEDIEIPSGFTIEADVKDFKLGNMYMYVASNLFEEESFDFLDEFDSLYSSIQSLKNASTQLVEGTATLKEGTQTYSEKLGEFNTGLSAYTQGVNSVAENYTKINDGITSVDSNTKQIVTGSKALSTGITELKTNLVTLMSGITSLQQGTDAIYSNLGALKTSVEKSITDIEASTSENSNAHKNLEKLGTETGTTIYKLTQTKLALTATVNGMEDGDTKTALLAEIDSLNAQIEELNTNVTNERAGYTNAINSETTQVLTGLNTIASSLEQLQGVALQVKNGVDGIAENSPALQAGLDELETGANKLSSGTSSLSTGIATLSSGANELKTGISTLNANSETIKNAGESLQEGAVTIADGANTLADGTTKFDAEGINSIYNLVNGDVKGLQTRIEKLMELSSSTDSENSTSYKYIVKVDGNK
jgi:putative membrane protein